jgi:ribonucleoside-diphosphate reductase alpha chain
MEKHKIVKKRVKSVSIIGNQDVFDIRTSKNHNFFANGILSHNCGETPMVPWLSCNLAMINVAKFVKEDSAYDWAKLFETAYNLCGLMNNMLDKMDFPDERFKDRTLKYKPVGIGPAGLSDALFLLGLKYNGKDGRDFAEEVMRTITHGAVRKSVELARESEPFHNYDKHKDNVERIVESLIKTDSEDDEVETTLNLLKEYGTVNSVNTTAAPTGTTALSCDCSYGIEPSFGLVFGKNLITGEKIKIVNPIFEQKFKNEPWFTADTIEKIFANGGSLKNIRGIPKEVKDVFVVAHDIKPKDRIEMQACLQKRVSLAISSTINLPSHTSVEEVSEIYKLSYELGLKGVTVYRDGCKKNQPVVFKKEGQNVTSTFERPPSLPSMKHCIEMVDGKLYVDVVRYNDRIVELWLDYGKSGQDINGLLEALGKSLSTGFQHGVPKEAYIKQFEGIKGEYSSWFRFDPDDKKPVQLFSIPDAVAKLLKRFYTKNNGELDSDDKYDMCPKCQTKSVIMAEGCSTCMSCGASQCS